ncbi:hypothetical protein HDF16_002541 [Granulicella aggregans]|uniref:Tetratricopeptide repeat protein n=1 Tax=Granulicella aggregans TaxID=474949 RepID=A0A7W7ZDC8_9BACT|nr:tetratricopeptide repeat protein [Granulicella aggregans]MBB5057835.1 hypothetical protein [Granulicella aggregans]
MEIRFGIRLALACGLLAGVPLTARAQTYTPPPPPLTTLPPCPLGKDGKPVKPTKKNDCDPTIYPQEKVKTSKKSADEAVPAATPANSTPAAQQFPFPGEQQPKPSETPAAQAFPFPGSDSVEHKPGDADVQHDPAAEKKAADTPAGKAFPFPGGSTADMPTDPDMPAPAKQPEDQAPSSSSSSSSSDADTIPGSTVPADSADAPGPKGQYDDDKSSAPKLKEKRKKAPPPQTDTERVDEDLSVAKYYGQSGNKMGAYLRAKDAVKIQPEYPEAHFVLGDAAQKLGKKDEALAEFTTYLKLAPDGERAKAAEKALDGLR